MEETATYKGGFRELEAWKESRIFKQGIIQICKQFPGEEKFNLTDQIKRSSRSITANIAEGYGRFNFQETIHFIRQARGSLNETLDHLITALDENYIDKANFEKFEKQYELVLKLINGYIHFLQKSKIASTASRSSSIP